MAVKTQIRTIAPGLTLAIAVTGAALVSERGEQALLGQNWIDGLVLAILIGTLIHTIWGLHPALTAGVHFAATTILEIAIVLLGASVSFATLGQAGYGLIGVVAAIVCVALVTSYGVGRLFGLSHHLATLVACGNSICGNSAIVAAAPVIGADADDVAASIAFTAALGIAIVLLLPLAPTLFGMAEPQYGMLAGLTVYAVPQVLAATVPIGIVSAQIGAIVKLMRVLMLGPVILLLGLRANGRRGNKIVIGRLVPWFIIGFLLAMVGNSFGLIPAPALAPIQTLSTLLTVVSMAALGLSVNIGTVMSSGGRVLATGIVSLLALASISLGAIYLLLPALGAA